MGSTPLPDRTNDEVFTLHGYHGTNDVVPWRLWNARAPVEPTNEDPYHPDLRVRVSRLEDDVHDVKAMMGQLVLLVTEMKATLDATLPHLVTKAEVAGIRSKMKSELAQFRREVTTDMAQCRQELSDLCLSSGIGFASVHQATSDLRGATIGEFTAIHADLAEKTYMWGVLTASLTAYACGLAALAMLK